MSSVTAGDRPDLEPDPNNPLTIHEALHMTSFLAGSVDIELVEHPAIAARPEWLALAETAAKALADLYQTIGAFPYDIQERV
jgi:hypothetical protein